MLRLILFALALTYPAFSAVLHNADVIRLIHDGTAVSEVIRQINSSESGFVLYDEDVNELRSERVPDEVIRAMFARQSGKKSNEVTVTLSDPPAKVSPDDSPYGFRRGAVAVAFAAGTSWRRGFGVGADVAGGFGVGLHRYVAAFGFGTYSGFSAGHVSFGAGGLEVVGTNRSRVVPYANLGAAYTSVSYGPFSWSAPGVAFGGGVRVYVRHSAGFTSGLMAVRVLGNSGGYTTFVPVFGFFGQSR